MCFGCSKELSHGDGSFEYPQHRLCLRNKKNNFRYTLLSWGLFVQCIHILMKEILPSGLKQPAWDDSFKIWRGNRLDFPRLFLSLQTVQQLMNGISSVSSYGQLSKNFSIKLQLFSYPSV